MSRCEGAFCKELGLVSYDGVFKDVSELHDALMPVEITHAVHFSGFRYRIASKVTVEIPGKGKYPVNFTPRNFTPKEVEHGEILTVVKDVRFWENSIIFICKERIRKQFPNAFEFYPYQEWKNIIYFVTIVQGGILQHSIYIHKNNKPFDLARIFDDKLFGTTTDSHLYVLNLYPLLTGGRPYVIQQVVEWPVLCTPGRIVKINQNTYRCTNDVIYRTYTTELTLDSTWPLKRLLWIAYLKEKKEGRIFNKYRMPLLLVERISSFI